LSLLLLAGLALTVDDRENVFRKMPHELVDRVQPQAASRTAGYDDAPLAFEQWRMIHEGIKGVTAQLFGCSFKVHHFRTL
jgi:hypothetical protein